MNNAGQRVANTITFIQITESTNNYLKIKKLNCYKQVSLKAV